MTTTIRLPEPVNSVIVGDSNLFQAEHSPTEPVLVFVKPLTSNGDQSNLVISTARGRQFLMLLRSLGPSADESESGVDLFVICRAAGVFFIDDNFAIQVKRTKSLLREIIAQNAILPHTMANSYSTDTRLGAAANVGAHMVQLFGFLRQLVIHDVAHGKEVDYARATHYGQVPAVVGLHGSHGVGDAGRLGHYSFGGGRDMHALRVYRRAPMTPTTGLGHNARPPP